MRIEPRIKIRRLKRSAVNYLFKKPKDFESTSVLGDYRDFAQRIETAFQKSTCICLGVPFGLILFSPLVERLGDNHPIKEAFDKQYIPTLLTSVGFAGFYLLVRLHANVRKKSLNIEIDKREE
ncbi:MAG: hypothetical protein QNJ31_02475 [Candidatus Caenarcaniphilales bacterium]|nr:hypothetical protein [Candidatus Caenarcaniphilales bacterium]